MIHQLLRTFLLTFAGILAAFLTSCASAPPPVVTTPSPFVPGPYSEFKAQNYPQKSTSWKDDAVLAATTPENSSLVISISKQRAFLMNGNQLAMDYPVATGKSSHPTPTGVYTIQEKTIDKRSNLYGKVVDANGTVVISAADSRKVKIPDGGKFVGAPMPYWMRFTWRGIGHHVGNVPRYPASHGCIRGQATVMPIVFEKVKIGTQAKIVH